MFLAEIILTSPQLVPSDDSQLRILHFMDTFLSTATYQSISEWETKHFHSWSIFLPYIKLLYIPEPVQKRDDVMCQLHIFSLKTALLSLLSKLGRDIHREVLFEESLEDYITCVPAYLPPGPLHEQAKELVKVTGSGTYQLQPPKLINLVKAKLAKLYFGLEQLVTMSVGEIINKLMPIN